METENTCKVSLETFKENYLPNSYDENMFDKDGKLNPKYNSFKKTGIFADIFDDHWEEFYSNNKDIVDMYRPNADTEIHKLIDCHNKNLGCFSF